jgi:hypothetical protein
MLAQVLGRQDFQTYLHLSVQSQAPGIFPAIIKELAGGTLLL